MNWYSKIRQARALEPSMWKTDPNPHRLRQHQDVAWTPYGAVSQPQDADKLEFEYNGVHLTDSFELAAIYANNKSTQEDPAIVIALYSKGLNGIPDIDARNYEPEIQEFLIDKKNEFNEILNDDSFDSSTKIEMIANSLEDDLMFQDGDDNQDPSDVVAEKERTPIQRAIIAYIQGFPDTDQAANGLRSLLNGQIPDKILMSVANQFRVMAPIGSELVHSIVQITRTNLEEFKNVDALREMDDEELEEEGVTRSDDDFLDEDGRVFVDYEDVSYGHWITQMSLYQNKNQVPDSDLTYHGTSLSRAKSAYPELLP